MSRRGALEGPESIDGLTAGRVETFSDTVFAIAITLLVLQLHVEDGPGSLADRLGDQWPLYVTYLLSFFNIGTVWLNHHSIFSRLRGAASAFCALWLWASNDRRLIRDDTDQEAIRLRTARMVIAVPAFSVPCVVAIWSPAAAVAIDGAIMVSFLLSDGWLERRMGVLEGTVARGSK